MTTLTDALRAAATTDRAVLLPEGPTLRRLPYAQLAEQAARLAPALAAIAPPRAPILLVLPNGEPLLTAFFAALWVDAIPAILAMPRPFGDAEAWASGVARTAEVADGAAILTLGPTAKLLAQTQAGQGLRVIEWETLDAAGPPLAPVAADPEATAILQLTSGSLGAPKGVALSHRAVLANARGIAERAAIQAQDIGCFWVPMAHDMALLGFVMMLVSPIDQVVMPTARFAQNPARWLEIVSERVSITVGPPFAFDLALQRLQRSGQTLDFRRLRACVVGAEPIDARILTRFQEALAPMGLRPDVFMPCYGLAESTCVVALGAAGQPVPTQAARPPFAVGQSHGAGHLPALTLVGHGPPLAGAHLRVVDDRGDPLPEGLVGHVQTTGPSRMLGYWRDPERTAQALTADGWLNTGDTGFLADDRVYLVGRTKDLILLRGRNVLPEAIEAVAADVEGVRPRGALAFGVLDPAGGPEAVHLVIEPVAGADPAPLAQALRRAIADALEVRLDQVHFAAPGALPRTTSGKLRRGEARARWGGLP